MKWPSRTLIMQQMPCPFSSVRKWTRIFLYVPKRPTLRVQKNPRFFKKRNPVGFFGVLFGPLDKQDKIGKIIQKLSNLKP